MMVSGGGSGNFVVVVIMAEKRGVCVFVSCKWFLNLQNSLFNIYYLSIKIVG
ncbi:hypothetical protein HanIR_Chr04g0163101 [Helianthus annuus]|nr:hypothetical protein HanIR_Chr04g0163101 [Helianthus annuus]